MNPADGGVVIVGAGLAGVETAAQLRDSGYSGTVTLIGDETGMPYQRPPLSKDFLAGGGRREIRPDDFFDQIDFRAGRRALEIDRRAKTVTLDDGATVPYAHLVLATGSRNRRLDIPGITDAGVHSLRTADDAEALARRLDTGGTAIVVGAGFIGMEFAAAARARGLDVTVLEFLDRAMARVVSPTISDYFAAAHRRAGVTLRFGEGITAVAGRDAGSPGLVVTTTTGAELRADFVVVGAGAVANHELAAAAGLDVDGGIVVDDCLVTSDPSIVAIGDCANFPSRFAADAPADSGSGRIRLESEQNATDQGRYAGRRLAGEDDGPYRDVPWFWTHQAEQELYIAGIARPGDEAVVRGDPSSGSFSVVEFRGGRLVAVESVNMPADHVAARKILAAGRTITPGEAADMAFDLKAAGKAAGKAVKAAKGAASASASALASGTSAGTSPGAPR